MAIIDIEKNHERFEKIFFNSGVGIFIVDKKRIIMECNETFCKMFGYKYNEIIGKSCDIIQLSETAYMHFADIAFNKVIKNKALCLNYKLKHKNGKILWIRISGDSISVKEEVLWIVIDITKRVAMEKKLKESKLKINRLNKTLNQEVKNQLALIREKDEQLQYQSRLVQMGEMLNMIAHQWRQPLGAISATTSFLSTSLMLNDFDKSSFLNEIDKIEKYAKHLSDTIDDFRNFFKLTKNKETTSLEELANMAINIVKPILQTKKIKIYTKYNCNTSFLTYKNEVSQVVLNLIKNSQDAFLENQITDCIIEISTYIQKSYFCLSIKDNAGGIKEEIMDKIFDLYFSTKHGKNGTGIGLYMSKIIIQDHCQGKLEARRIKNGSLFTIKLPK
ncbi:MAG: PAS domain S-box protein [Campylobacter sp.]|nr:PAS domain S-box protein [Campylobacter sp.]